MQSIKVKIYLSSSVFDLLAVLIHVTCPLEIYEDKFMHVSHILKINACRVSSFSRAN